MIRFSLLIVTFLCIASLPIQAQTLSEMEGKLDTAYFAKKNTGHIKIDGNLTEEIWQHAQK
ncbi:MAG: hypothetical protein RL642_860, partial [Bacteroidota bacterium]